MIKLVDPAIGSRPDLAKEIDRATDLLTWEMGASASTAKAEWSLMQDTRSRDVIELRVSDWTGSVGYRFAPDELANRPHMQYRLRRLWGDLLMVRSHVQMDGHLGPYQEQEDLGAL
jgi:hypothetical protein